MRFTRDGVVNSSLTEVTDGLLLLRAGSVGGFGLGLSEARRGRGGGATMFGGGRLHSVESGSGVGIDWGFRGGGGGALFSTFARSSGGILPELLSRALDFGLGAGAGADFWSSLSAAIRAAMLVGGVGASSPSIGSQSRVTSVTIFLS